MLGSGFITLPAYVKCSLINKNKQKKKQRASHLKYFIDKHTLAKKDNELNTLFL